MTPAGVEEACRRWVWISPHSTRIATDRWLMVRNPDRFVDPVELRSVDPTADPAAVLDEVVDRARGTGAAQLTFWVQLGAPEGYVELLAARGAVLQETLAVLALDLGGGVPLRTRSAGAEIDWVVDAAGVRDSESVDLAVFGGEQATDTELERDVTEAAAEHEAGTAGRVVARIDGHPVGSAGVTLVDLVENPGRAACLWGGAVLEPFRRRGVYAQMLQARLERGVKLGATMALVKGRMETSAPILRRLGFEQFGVQRSFVVPIDCM